MAARTVAAGILVSRILGFVRERVFAHYFGNSPAAGAFRAAMRIPNAIRNLLGEGTLSASFIPVYSGLLARGDTEGARAVAGGVVGLLTAVTGLAAAAGIVLAPLITDAVAPGLSGATRDLTVTLVRILFPMSGVLILAAWCLGILNSHGRFFLSYAAPAVWNVAQIVVLVAAGATLAGAPLAVALAWGALGGGLLQVAVQLPGALRAAGGVRPSLGWKDQHVRRVVRAWLPVVIGAGVVQVSAVIETQLASFLGPQALAQLGYAQLIALLPVSLFGVSVAASALPEMSRDAAQADHQQLRDRLAAGLRRVAYFVVPSAFAFVVIGPALVGALYETGAFDATDTAIVSGILAAYGVGVLAQAAVKLLASGFYAVGDTRTPVRIAIASVVVSAGLGAWLMQFMLAPGIALGAAVGAWLNVSLLGVMLARRIGWPGARHAARWNGIALGGSALAATAGWGTWHAVDTLHPFAGGFAAAAAFGIVYLATTSVLGHPDAPRAASN